MGVAPPISTIVCCMIAPHEAVLNEHLAAENAHDLDRIMATYTASPVIELNGSRIDGSVAVREFHRSFGFGGAGAASFSDVHIAERGRHHTHEATIIEQTLTAVHTGVWRGIPATGRTVSIVVCTVYVFEDGKLARENVYLDEGRLRHLLTKPGEGQPFVSSRDIILRAETLDEAARFYGTVLGMKVTMDSEGMLGFETGALQLFVEKGAPAHGPVFEMYVPDVKAARERLCSLGCSVVEEDPRVPRCYVRDPFGLVFNLAER
jgi:predicted enzyme related to lactoylglutathione lyase